MSKKGEEIRVEGVVKEMLPNAHFIVELTEEGYAGHKINAHLSGKMRLHYIKIMPGDKVIVRLTPYDLEKGIILYRGSQTP